MLIAQISDLHVLEPGELQFGQFDTNAALGRAVDTIRALNPRPDIVLATGDLTDHGTISEYEMLAEILTPLTMPFYLLPGNHDLAPFIKSAFPDHDYLPDRGRLNYVIDDHPVRLVGLDTAVPGEIGGSLGEEGLAFLDGTLAAAPDRPTVVFMHHPPFLTGIAGMDRYNCADGDAMAAIVARNPQVERVLCGHCHRPIQTRWAGTLASVCPSVAPPIEFNLVPDSGVRLTFEPAAIQLHLWRPEIGVVSHMVYAEDFGEPLMVLPPSNGEA
ncbi:3',5'-cyclic adenosine monophosphate phosphodiesterase CpdA [Oceanibacterium hippocampi]|uniref:3',5'-cyclic adenosine monophosphate phosphodiesterase CpdA n=2 Tax=Oceanibacterium hippocampi TaxID=745714 RepID=A0A1Y5SGV5_9PROT|nr:3',5'-cyclic adenosine monophosphate phosphodiesterase CpdA [Oceanibacterium hippocampi]